MEAKIYMKHGPISFSPLITVLALKAPMRYAIYRERLTDAFTDGYVKTKYFFTPISILQLAVVAFTECGLSTL